MSMGVKESMLEVLFSCPDFLGIFGLFNIKTGEKNAEDAEDAGEKRFFCGECGVIVSTPHTVSCTLNT